MPHIMRYFHPIVFSLALLCCACMMSSCLNDSAVSSPTIRSYSQMYRTSPEGVKDTLYLADTVRIGDTLRLPVLLYGGYNILTSFQVSSDPLDHKVKLEVDSAVAAIVDPQSDLEKGKLIFPPDRQVLMCNVTVCFIPQRAGSQPIDLTVANTAGDKYSPVTYTFTPIVAKGEE